MKKTHLVRVRPKYSASDNEQKRFLLLKIESEDKEILNLVVKFINDNMTHYDILIILPHSLTYLLTFKVYLLTIGNRISD